jgi:hypothetical protein
MNAKRSLISHLARHAVPLKQCCVCHRDVGQEWRTKTPDGKYFCRPCIHALKEFTHGDSLGLYAGSAPLPCIEAKSSVQG